MNPLRSVTLQPSGTRSIPLTSWAAASSGAVIGAALALIAGSLWAAAAFSSHNSAFYNHLAWWLGGTMIGIAFIGAVIAGGLSNTRGASAGIVNGLTTWALVSLATAIVVAIAAIAHGTTATVSLKSSVINVELVRPYIAFWSAVAGLAAAAIGGLAGGLIPRRGTKVNVVELIPVAASRYESPSSSTSSNRTASRAAG
jgi:hypothetical protein